MTSKSSTQSPFAFQPDDKVGRGFVRVLEQLAGEMRRLLECSHGTLPESAHGVRVLIKRLRALLWFASPAFSSSELKQSKSHLRKAAHLLAVERESEVMRSIWVDLSRETSSSAYRKILVRIAQAEREPPATAGKPGRAFRQAGAMLLRTIKELKESSKTNLRWPAPPERLARAFAAAEKSGRKALHGKESAQFHDWRKKAKRLLYQLQMTQGISCKRSIGTINRVDKLQEALGDYHDSVIAQDRLRQNAPDKMPARLVRHSVRLLEKRKHRLRKNVRKIARRLNGS